jgi:hypothetical protein
MTANPDSTRTVCAWCSRGFKPGPDDTHGICPRCARKYRAQVQGLAFDKAFMRKEATQ